MAQASVLTDAEIRRVFRIIETTRHADRNRLAFILSLYAGLRVGEIASLAIGDVLTQKDEVRREIKLDPHQTKGSRGRTVVLSSRVGTEIAVYVKTRRIQRHEDSANCISTQRSRILQRNSFDAVQGNIRAGRNSNLFAFWKAHICDSSEREGCGHADHPKTYGSSSHRDDRTILRRVGRDVAECRGAWCEVEGRYTHVRCSKWNKKGRFAGGDDSSWPPLKMLPSWHGKQHPAGATAAQPYCVLDVRFGALSRLKSDIASSPR